MTQTRDDLAQNDLKREKRIVGVISIIWFGILATLFAWQAFYYRGIVERLAEWQYDVLDHYYPGTTIFLLCLFFSLPLLVMLLILRQRWKKMAKEVIDPPVAALRYSRRLERFCEVVAVAAGAVAFASLVSSFLLPDGVGKPRVIDIEAVGTDSVPDGKATLKGPVDLDVLVQFDQRALLLRRQLLFAPVHDIASPGPARFFVEVREQAHLQTPLIPQMSGVLKRDSLPGDVRRLYQNIGYPIDPVTYLLYRDAERLRWPYLMIAAQLVVVSIIFSGVVWLERRRRRRIERKMAEDLAAPAGE